MKKIGIVLAAVLAVLLGVLLWWNNRTENLQTERIKVLYAQTRPLEKERQELQNELDQLPHEYLENRGGKATEQLVFTELDEKLYTEVYPLMNEFEAVGVMALNLREMPGMDDKINWEQFDEMLASGWSYCLAWDGQNELFSWLEMIQTFLDELGRPMPKALYFDSGLYHSQSEEILVQYGISIAIHHGEENLPLVVTEETDDIWLLGCRPWNGDYIRSITDDFVDLSGNLTFSVNFGETDEAFNPTGFRNMLTYVTKYSDEEKLLITSFEDARSVQNKAQAERVQFESDLTAKKEDLQAQLDNVNSQLQELYNSLDGE